MSTTGRKPDPPRTRAAGLWVSCVLFAVVLLLLLIFTLQNSQHARVSFFGWHASLPLGVALLLAAVFGVLLVALPGTARIVQLRVLSRRRNRAAQAVTGPAVVTEPSGVAGPAVAARPTAATEPAAVADEPTPLPNTAPGVDPVASAPETRTSSAAPAPETRAPGQRQDPRP